MSMPPLGHNVVVGNTIGTLNIEASSPPFVPSFPIWGHDVKPHESFTGRDQQLEQLTTILQTSPHCRAYVTGTSGMGKSTLAREYAWQHRKQYDIVWILDATSEASLSDGLQRLGQRIHPARMKSANLVDIAYAVLTDILPALAQPTLLVFDNLNNRQVAHEWLPRTDAGIHVIVTTHLTTWEAAASIPMKVWSVEAGQDYMIKRCSQQGRSLELSDARTIAKKLDCLPLALSHAAAYLAENMEVSADRYLQRLTQLLDRVPEGSEYPRSVLATFHAAIANAEQKASGSAAILCLAAFFAPTAIPQELFCQDAMLYSGDLRPQLRDVSDSALDLHSVLRDQDLREEALSTLQRLSLINSDRETCTLNVHALVQLSAQSLLSNDKDVWSHCAVDVLNALMPSDMDYGNWPKLELYVPHAQAALNYVAEDLSFAPAGFLANQCGYYLYERAFFSKAEPLYRRALAICEQSYEPDYPKVATCLNNLAGLLSDTNRFLEAEPLYRRALAILEQCYGPDHQKVATCLNNIALLLQYTNRLSEAELLYRRAITINEQSYGPDHPHVATRLNNLASLFEKTDRLSEAEPLYRRALAIDEQSYGPDHPRVTTSLNNLAELLRNTNRFSEAEPLYRRALAIDEQSYGPDHPHVATSLNNLALLLENTNRISEAEPLFRRALTILEQRYGPDHPEVATSLNNLAKLLRTTNRFSEAEPLYRRAHEMHERNSR